MIGWLGSFICLLLCLCAPQRLFAPSLLLCARETQVVAPETAEVERALLLLQRLLRGRAVQNAMFAGKQKLIPLIRELRLMEWEADAAVAAQQQAEAAQAEQKAHDAALDCLKGEVVSDALDFVSKEVVRLREEERVVQFVNRAQAARTVREAEESGRRQTEQLIRQKKERLFQEVLSAHHHSADRLLDDVLRAAVADAARDSALAEAAVKQTVLEPLVGAVEEKQKQQQAAAAAAASADPASAPHKTAVAVVTDLLHAFVLPEVSLRWLRNRPRRRRKKQPPPDGPLLSIASCHCSLLKHTLANSHTQKPAFFFFLLRRLPFRCAAQVARKRVQNKEEVLAQRYVASAHAAAAEAIASTFVTRGERARAGPGAGAGAGAEARRAAAEAPAHDALSAEDVEED